MTQQTQTLQQAGVTLIELAIVLAIIGVLAVMAAPSIIDRWQRETVVLVADRLASSISLAQITAQRRHVQMQIAPRGPTLGWASGWQVTEVPQSTAPGAAPASGRDILMSVVLPTVPAIQVNIPRDTLTYAAVGYSRMTGGAVSNITLTLSSGRHTRCVVINDAGRPRITEPAKGQPCGSASSADNADP